MRVHVARSQIIRPEFLLIRYICYLYRMSVFIHAAACIAVPPKQQRSASTHFVARNMPSCNAEGTKQKYIKAAYPMLNACMILDADACQCHANIRTTVYTLYTALRFFWSRQGKPGQQYVC